MGDYSIVQFREQHLEAACALEEGPHGTTAGEIREAWKNKRGREFFVIMDDNEKLVGFCYGGYMKGPPGSGYEGDRGYTFEHFRIDKQHQRKGCMLRLVLHLANEFKDGANADQNVFFPVLATNPATNLICKALNITSEHSFNTDGSACTLYVTSWGEFWALINDQRKTRAAKSRLYASLPLQTRICISLNKHWKEYAAGLLILVGMLIVHY